MTKKKISKQITKVISKKKLNTSSCDKNEKIMAEDKIRATKSNENKSSAPTSYVNSSENDKILLKTQRKKIEKKKKEGSKVHCINNFKNDAAIPTEKRYYSQIDECSVLLADSNELNKNHKTHKASTSNSAKISPVNNNEYSSIFNTQGRKIKKANKEDSEVQNVNYLKNDNATVLTDTRHYSQIRECFVLLSDFNEHRKIHKSPKVSSSNSAKISSKNNNEYSSMVKTKEQNINKKKKDNSKVQNKNNFLNENAVVHTKKRRYSQINECFVLLSDFNELKTNHISNKSSSSSNTKISLEKDKDSSRLKTQGKKIKKINKSKVQKINNLKNDNAVIHTEKKNCSPLKECFVLLSDCNEHNINHTSNQSSSSSNTKISSENDEDHSLILKTRGKKIKKINKSKVQKINNLKNENAAIHTEKKNCSQLKECFVLLSDFSEHKKSHKPKNASTKNKSMIGSKNNKEYLSILGMQDQNIKKILRSKNEKK